MFFYDQIMVLARNARNANRIYANCAANQIVRLKQIRAGGHFHNVKY